ncbi:hypothetical protein GQR58_015356 [Nymphon striatum]|nr:hypothetical protein GQR58_015356 [Nymphon striatum]
MEIYLCQDKLFGMRFESGAKYFDNKRIPSGFQKIFFTVAKVSNSRKVFSLPTFLKRKSKVRTIHQAAGADVDAAEQWSKEVMEDMLKSYLPNFLSVLKFWKVLQKDLPPHLITLHYMKMETLATERTYSSTSSKKSTSNSGKRLGVNIDTKTTFLTMTITIERYISVRYPLKTKTFCTSENAVKVIWGIVVAAIAINVPRFFANKPTIITMPDSIFTHCVTKNRSCSLYHPGNFDNNLLSEDDMYDQLTKIYRQFLSNCSDNLRLNCKLKIHHETRTIDLNFSSFQPNYIPMPIAVNHRQYSLKESQPVVHMILFGLEGWSSFKSRGEDGRGSYEVDYTLSDEHKLAGEFDLCLGNFSNRWYKLFSCLNYRSQDCVVTDSFNITMNITKPSDVVLRQYEENSLNLFSVGLRCQTSLDFGETVTNQLVLSIVSDQVIAVSLVVGVTWVSLTSCISDIGAITSSSSSELLLSSEDSCFLYGEMGRGSSWQSGEQETCEHYPIPSGEDLARSPQSSEGQVQKKSTIELIKKIESSGTIWSRSGQLEKTILGEIAP